MSIKHRCNRLLTPLSLVIIGLLIITNIVEVKMNSQFVLNSDFGRFYESQQLQHNYQDYYKKVYALLKSSTSPQADKWVLTPNLNPPFFNVLLTPLGYLNYNTALSIWTTLSILCEIISILLVVKTLNFKLTPFYNAACFIIAIMVYYPNCITVQMGQVSLILLLPFVLAWRCARQNQECLAALLIGLLTSIKPFFALFAFYFFWRREWYGLATWFATVVICLLIGYFAAGLNNYVEYINTLMDIKWYTCTWNASILGALLRLLGGNNEGNIPLINIPYLAYSLYYLIAFILIIFLRHNLLTPVTRDPKLKVDFDVSLVSIMMLMLSPFGWRYYFGLLLIAFFTLLRISEQTRWPHTVLFLSLLVLFLTGIPSTDLVPIQLKRATDIFISMGLGIFPLSLMLINLLISRRTLIDDPTKYLSILLPPKIIKTLMLVVLLPSIVCIPATVLVIRYHPERYLPLFTRKIYYEPHY